MGHLIAIIFIGALALTPAPVLITALYTDIYAVIKGRRPTERQEFTAITMSTITTIILIAAILGSGFNFVKNQRKKQLEHLPKVRMITKSQI